MIQTVDDIKAMQVVLIGKDNDACIGIVDDDMVKMVVLNRVKFMRLDPSKYEIANLGEFLPKKKDDAD